MMGDDLGLPQSAGILGEFLIKPMGREVGPFASIQPSEMKRTLLTG
jgi:hypothetical protein